MTHAPEREATRGSDYAPEAGDVVDAPPPGWMLLDFGTNWCGHCAAARGVVDAWMAAHPAIAHRRIEDGKGRKPGRLYRVKLWPTLVLLHDGEERARVVRPRAVGDLAPLDEAMA